MKKYLLMILLMIMAGCGAFASHSLDITDYDTTVSGAKLTTLDLGYSKDTRMNPYGLEKSGATLSQIDLNHRNFYDSYNTAWDYELFAERYSMVMVSETSPTWKMNSNYYGGNAEYRDYFDPKNNYFQGVSAYWYTNNDDDDTSPVYDNIESGIAYEAGKGHIVDITPLAEAGVLEDRLTEAGMLKGNLSKADMLKLAEIIRKWRMDEYDYKNPQTTKGHFLADISKVLEASGKLTRPLGGFAFWRISESRTTNYLRAKGERITLGLGLEHDAIYTHNPGDINSTNNQYNCFTFTYDKRIPIDWVSQFNCLFETKVALNPEDAFPPINNHYLSIRYTYDLTNNLWLSADFYYDRNNYQNDVERSNSVSTKNYDFSINYKIEDLYITTLSLEKEIEDDGDSTEDIELSYTLYL